MSDEKCDVCGLPHDLEYDCEHLAGERPSELSATPLLACAVQLLKVAVCPNCDGSG